MCTNFFRCFNSGPFSQIRSQMFCQKWAYRTSGHICIYILCLDHLMFVFVDYNSVFNKTSYKQNSNLSICRLLCGHD